MGLDFPVRSATDFGHRYTFAALASATRDTYQFEPISGLGIVFFAGRPNDHTKQTRRAKAAVKRAYDDILENEES